MKPRESTADDLVYSLNRILDKAQVNIIRSVKDLYIIVSLSGNSTAVTSKTFSIKFKPMYVERRLTFLNPFFRNTEVEIYKSKQEERKHALGQESDQKNN